MKRDWRPGDVAMVTAHWVDTDSVRNVRKQVAALRVSDGWQRLDSGDHKSSDGVFDARPLVVIDPEDRVQIERLTKVLGNSGAFTGYVKGNADALRDALRGLIAPPKPEEPLGLGAVAEDVDGGVWVKWSTLHRADRNWKRHDEQGGNYRAWVDLDVVHVRSTGWIA